MTGILREVRPRRIDERRQHGEPGVRVARAIGTARVEQMSEPEQALRRDRRGRAVDRLVVVERIGGAAGPVAECGKTGGPGVPVGHPVLCRRVLDVEVAGRGRGVEHPALDLRTSAERRQCVVGLRRDEFQLFGKAEHRPGEPARPRAERRVALLRARASDAAVGRVEHALVHDPAADVVVIAIATVVDAEIGRRARVLEQPFEQADLRVLLV